MLSSNCVSLDRVFTRVPARLAGFRLRLATTPLPLAFALVGLNVTVKAGGVGVELPDLQTQSFSPSWAPVLFIFSPQRGQLWSWDPRRAETPPALCSLRMTSALHPPPAHARPRCSLNTLQSLCCFCSWWICDAEQQHSGQIFMLFIFGCHHFSD